VTLGDIGGGGGHPAVCNAIRDDGPQNCSADDVSPATGLSTQVQSLGAHPASGLSLLNAAADDWWTPASATATIRYAIMNYVDSVSGIRAGQPAESIIRNAGYDLITAAASACPDFGMNIVGGWVCHHAVATLAWELGWPNWHNELAQRPGVSAVSVGGGVVSAEFQVSGTNSMDQMNAEIARRNACSTMADALQRNECPSL